MKTSRTIIQRQSGEPPTKRCNGPKHNGAQVPVEEFGLSSFQRADGTYSRKGVCFDCDCQRKKDARRKANKRRGRPPGCNRMADDRRPAPRISSPARPDQIGVARQPGEPETRRCNGPLCKDESRPIEQFGVTKRKYRNGNYQRRLRCLACEGVTMRQYEENTHRRDAEPERRVTVVSPVRLAFEGRHWIIAYDADCQRMVLPATPDIVRHLRAAGVLPTPADDRAWARVFEGRAG